MKFYEMRLGRAKHIVSYHDGTKKHGDGSDFYDIRIFGNEREKDRFVRSLIAQGYTER